MNKNSGVNVVSDVLGDLRQDLDIDDWLISQRIEIPLLDNLKVAFVIENEDSSMDELDFTLPVSNFLSMCSMDRVKFSGSIFDNYKDSFDYLESDKSSDEATEIDRIWDRIDVTDIHVLRGYSDDDSGLVYVQVLAECDWEPEHGLQLIFKNGNVITRVSQQDGSLYD